MATTSLITHFNNESTKDYPLNVSYNWIISCLRNIEKREKYFDRLFKGDGVSLHVDQLSESNGLTSEYIKELIRRNGNVRFTYHPITAMSSFSKSMTGRYDIIYCALIDGRFPTHNRSARGILEITSEFSRNRDDGMYYETMKGTVHMPPSIPNRFACGVLSNGGTFSFTEKKRSHLVYINKTDRLEDLSTIPMINIATHGAKENVNNDDPNDVNGMIKRFSQKTAIGLGNNFDEEVEDIQNKINITREHYEKTCSWLLKYTKLPIEVTRIIGSYLRPPPFFFFEKGDLCLETMSYDTGDSNVGYNHFFVARRVNEEHHI